jgi:peptidoglycan/LPS O-acetylase OafA/YrhL
VKNSQWIGIAAALLLIGACFLPWAYFPDLQKDFTGFFSEKNAYGRPGKVFVFLSGSAIILFLIPKIWAKRVNIFIGAITIAFAVKCFILFSACYKGTCPEKKTGLFLVVLASALMTLAAVFPDTKLKDRS